MASPKKPVIVAASGDNKTKDELLNTLPGIGAVNQSINVSETPSGEGIFFQNRPEASDLSDANWDNLADFFNEEKANTPGEKTSIFQTAFFLEETPENKDAITESLNLQQHDAFEDFNEWDLFDSGNTLANLPSIQPKTAEMQQLLNASNKTPDCSEKSENKSGTNPGISAIYDENQGSSQNNLPQTSAKQTAQTAEFEKNQAPVRSQTPQDKSIVHHFEGTNEVFIKSESFDKLCSSPAKLSNLPAPSPSSREVNSSPDTPVIHHFEGTNEIFIQSSVFDALCDETDSKASEDSSDHKIQVKDRTGSLKLSVPRLKPAKSSASSESNIFGIVSTGFLPNVEIDKSYDLPCSEEMQTSPDNKLLSEAVFASRLSESKKSNAAVQDGVSKDISVASSCGLPNLNNIPKQNSNNARKIQVQNAVDQFDEARFLNISNSNIDIKEIGIKKDIDNLFELCEDIFTLDVPKTVFVAGGEDADRSRIIRAFITKNNGILPVFTCYTAARSCYSHDIITALLSSRIGCTPDTPEPEKLSKINQFCEKFFEKTDIRWGRDILYIRFGLSKFIMLQKAVQALTARSDTDALEVLLYLIEHDAREGLVTIAISNYWLNYGQVWRDVVKHISELKCGDILILIDTPNHIKAWPNTSVLSVSPYSENDIHEILETVLAEYNLPTEMLEELSRRITPNFHGLRRALRVIQQAVQTGRDINTSNDFDQAFIKSLENNERQLLGAASLLTQIFNIDDLIRVMMLQPMKDEIVWFEEKRREWCLNLAEKLTEENELIPLETPGFYRVNEKNFIAELMLRNKLNISRYLQKAYVSVLIGRNAESIEIAKACDNAGLLDKSPEYWMLPLKKQITSFSNQSADVLVRYCMMLISPDNPKIYQKMMLLCLEHLYQIGNYPEVITYAETLSRTGYITNDEKCSALAFIWQGRAMTQTGQYTQAHQRLLYALKLAEKLDNKELISDACFSLSALFFESGEKGALVNALRYAEKSLDISRKLGSLEKIAESQTLCSAIYQRRGEPQRAETAANEAYHALTVAGFWYKTPLCLCVMAKSAASLEKPLSIDNIERGFEIVNKTNNPVQRFELLETRIQLMMNTLQRQQIRSDLEEMNSLIKSYPYLPWITRYLLLHAAFDFSRKNYKKTTKSLKLFFDSAAKLKNSYLMSLGYVLSAELNFEVSKRNLSKISQEKTKKLYITSTSILESLGAWHSVAETLRKKAAYLEYINETAEAEEARTRADKVDPYCQ